MRSLIIAAALVATPAAAATEQFDLVCNGKTRESSIGRWKAAPETRYRIDLAANRWCQGDCKQPEKIYEVSETKLTLKWIKEDTPRSRALIFIKIDRSTGAWENYWSSSFFSETAGQCEVAPFTEFPVTPTKF
jgi:hypothetical protein